MCCFHGSLRDGEVSDLKIHLDELRLKLLREEKAKEELQKHYEQELQSNIRTRIESFERRTMETSKTQTSKTEGS